MRVVFLLSLYNNEFCILMEVILQWRHSSGKGFLLMVNQGSDPRVTHCGSDIPTLQPDLFPPSSYFLVAEQLYTHPCVSVCLSVCLMSVVCPPFCVSLF